MPPSGTPQGVSGVPRSEWRVLPSRRLKPVGNRAPLGVRRGQQKLPPRERDVYIQNGGIFRRSEKNRKFCRDKSHARYLFSLRKHLREIASNRRGRLIEKREVLIWQ